LPITTTRDSASPLPVVADIASVTGPLTSLPSSYWTASASGPVSPQAAAPVSASSVKVQAAGAFFFERLRAKGKMVNESLAPLFGEVIGWSA